MRVSAKADYAVRAAAELAAAEEGPVKGERLAEAQDIPLQFLEHILLELKHAGIVRARRGAKGGYWLARPADEVTIADVVRAVEGPIAHVQSAPPESIEYRGNAEHLQEVWIAVRASLRTVLEHVTLADLVSGELPADGRGARGVARRLGASTSTRPPRSGGRRHAAGDDVDEVLQVPGGPALEGAVAVALVGGHHRVAVVPVERGSGLSQKRRPARSATWAKTSAWGSRPLVRASPSTITVERGSRSSEISAEELEPDAAVVGVAGDVGDAALAGDPLGDRRGSRARARRPRSPPRCAR